MSNTAFVDGLIWNLPAATSAVYGVPNAAQSLAGLARVATTVEVGVVEDEVELEEDKADVGERTIDDDDADDDNEDWLLNKIRALLSICCQKALFCNYEGGK